MAVRISCITAPGQHLCPAFNLGTVDQHIKGCNYQSGPDIKYEYKVLIDKHKRSFWFALLSNESIRF